MEQSTSLGREWQAAGDDFDDLPEVRQAREIYEGQKLHLHELLKRAICLPIGSGDAAQFRRDRGLFRRK
jgi:hypothetical protein